jgi:UDP-N-acetylmuramoylalanine--D-glutamate ligase
MISLPAYHAETAVFGLGRSGLSVVRALVAAGNVVSAWDQNSDQCAAAEKAGAQIQDLEKDFGAPARLVLSPGVPLTHPQPHAVVKAAHAAHVPVLGDVELFADAVRAMAESPQIVAVTGTNGKSTTSALIAHLLAACGAAVRLGGNIGNAVLDLDMPDPHTQTVYVLELSSYQIDLLTTLAPDVAVLTNLSPDHLDRHGDMDGYIAAKSRLFDMLAPHATAVIGCDDDDSRKVADAVHATGTRVTRIAASREADIFWRDGALMTAQTAFADLANAPALRGAHNGQNAAAAAAVLGALGHNINALEQAFASFPGLAHRLQPIARHENLIFVNDSKATNAEATRHALAAYDNIYWIVGGRAKDEGLAGLDALYKNVRAAFLIGEAAERFQSALEGHFACHKSETLDKAVCEAANRARADAAPATVLLSPACASFDQFSDFEARGEAFCAAVAKWQSAQPQYEGASC